MPWGFTLEQIRAATKAQIINWVTTKLNNMTKRQIIELLLDIYSVSRPPVVVLGPDGQVVSMETVEEDVTGAVKGSQLIEWTYFLTKPYPVKDIIVTKLDAAGTPIERMAIRHYTTGKQPTVTVEQSAGEIPAPIGK